ncbi:hypothetical protein BDV95DRAFT_628602 [Massariosphaeria phaeospora]|uniref:Uncharacterized protein n=1 Tax=Massariosphaeria phaeospora TaxID=100035 RepID=A0A7C8M8U3_9PLEO|nr:hypothetical protein BDV95DRAFT_628602 [Massariosphaeria phaeospora]
MKADRDGGQVKHKRSISGNLLNSLAFLRPKEAPSQSPPKHDHERPEENAEGTKRGSAIANALRQSQGRKRKGSLRKTAILGTKNMLRERRNSILTQRPVFKQPIVHSQMATTSLEDHADDDETTPRRFSYENPSLNSSSDSGWPPPRFSASRLDLDGPADSTPRLLASPLTGPFGAYASTTDDDEGLSFYRPATSSSSSSYMPIQLQSQVAGASLQRRRSNRSGQHSSLTIVHTPADLPLDDEWDYSETEWWGWVVLIVTWIVFVVGMGSCLGVWSWAWDVGETPYAPPELEDDPTLPITGYYPALMVCTAVMAWVWVVVAWVGMKYFRHAKVVGEDR